MYYYKICGLKIACDFLLEIAEPVRVHSSEKCDVMIHKGHIDDGIYNMEPPPRKYEGEFIYLVRHEQGISWVNVIDHGCFIVQNGNEIIYRLKDGHNPVVIEEIIYCACIGSIIMVQRGQLMMHGGGVCINDKALIITGSSGAGKSTFTDELLRGGASFMADDFVALSTEDNIIWAHTAYPQRKLLADAVERFGYDKSRLILLPSEIGVDNEEKYALRLTEGFCKEKKLLGALVVLNVHACAETGSIEEITGSEKLKYVVDNLYGHSIYKRVGLQRGQFLACADIANKIPVFRLIRPQSGFSPAQMAELLYAHL